MGSLVGGGASKKAAKTQAAALDKQTRLQTLSTSYQIQAMADQMATAAAQQAASEYADKLLSAPIDTVDITLGTSDLDLKTNDLIGRRRTNRQQYQRIVPTSASRLTSSVGAALL